MRVFSEWHAPLENIKKIIRFQHFLRKCVNLSPCQAKVEDLELAILVDGDVWRLQVPVDYPRGVDVPGNMTFDLSLNKKDTSCRGLSGRSGTGRGRRRASESWWCCSGQPPSGGSPRLTLLMWSKYKTVTYHVNISKLVKGALRCEAVQEANDLKVVYHISHIRKEDVDL